MTAAEEKAVHRSPRAVHSYAEFDFVEYYQRSTARMGFYVFLNVCTAFTLLVVSSWWIQCFTLVARRRANSPEMADYALVRKGNGKYEECEIRSVESPQEKGLLKFFEYKKNRYVFNPVNGIYERRPWTLQEPLADMCAACVKGGLSPAYARALLRANGPNSVDIPHTSLIVMLLHRVAHPFYVFQVFSCLLWFFVDYALYAGVILTMSAASISWELYSAKHSEWKLRELMKCDVSVKVFRGKGNVVLIPADELVLGDLVIVESGKLVVADMAVVSGEAVVDEASLTGESHPVPKYHIPYQENPYDVYTTDKYKANTLFAGSTVVHAKAENTLRFKHSDGNNVLAIVVSTGFSTSKGEMFRSILFPSKVEIKFYRDSYYFLGILAVVAVGAFVMRLVDGLMFGQSGAYLAFRSLDLVTIAVPPALPLILTVGIGFALRRLNKCHVFSIDPERINFAGRVNIFCFDKTGTLTSEDLHYHSVVTFHPETGECVENLSGNIPDNHPVERVFATCHGLSIIGDGSLVGPAIDKEMFRVTHWTLEDPEPNSGPLGIVVPPIIVNSAAESTPLAILRRFDFDPQLARASVIFYEMKDEVQDVTAGQTLNELFVACKGSAESVVRICRPSSIPPSFEQVLCKYSNMGLYVLACAFKKIDASTILHKSGLRVNNSAVSTVKRADVECDFDFVALLVMANPLKPQSIGVINTLHASAVKTVIITGDSILTAVTVARELNLVDKVLLIDVASCEGSEKSVVSCQNFDEQPTAPEPLTIAKLERALYDDMDLAMTGAAIEHMRCSGEFEDHFIRFLVLRTRVFARARPKQKSWVVEQMMAAGNYVGMCGDGMNDCGALKTAHAGIALSNTDASIVAPFTSKQKRISDVLVLVKEGRCALETSFMAFKYMMLYPIIQTMMQATLNHEQAALSATQFIWDDLCIVLGLSIFMLHTGPAERLLHRRPPGSLLHPQIIASVGGQVAICILFFAAAHVYLYRQPWLCTVQESMQYYENPEKYVPPANRPNQVCLTPDADRADDDFSKENYQTSHVWLYGHFQYVITAVAFNLFTHFRTPMWSNRLFTLFSVLSFGFCAYFLLAPERRWLRNAFQLVTGSLSNEFKLVTLAIAVANLIAAVACEYAVIEHLVPAGLAHARRRRADRRMVEERELLGGPLPVGVVSGLCESSVSNHWLAVRMERNADSAAGRCSLGRDDSNEAFDRPSCRDS